MTPGLREHKQASLRIAIPECLPEDMRDQSREIVSLTSTNPRKGHATVLMWTVCHEADQARMLLILQPKHFGDGELDDRKLERFYGKFGFLTIQRDPAVLMARSPDLVKRIAVMQ